MKTIIDCDPGHDDAIAILYAAQHLDIVGITTIFGNQTVEKTTLNALKVLTLAGLDYPVAKGCDRPLIGSAPLATDVHGASGLDGVDLPEPSMQALDQHAVSFLIEQASRHRGELAVAITGAHTNVAMALRLEPRLKACGIELEWAVEQLAPLARLDAGAMRQLQFMLFEAISNVMQHARASRLRIEAQQTVPGVRIVVVDNGCGFDATQTPRRGLRLMQERATAIGAQLQMHSRAGQTGIEIAFA